MDLRPSLLVLALVVTGCSTGGESPEQACAEPRPGEVLEECRDFGEGEGPLDE